MHADAEDPTCVIRGACNGPLAALAALLLNPAIPAEVATFAPDLQAASNSVAPCVTLTPTPILPDTPPPRA
jgi:hypothetical protein